MLTTPKEAGFRQPAEWTPHRACWLAWPAHADLWLENLAPAQQAFASLCKAIASGPDETREGLDVLVKDDAAEAAARSAIGHLAPRFHRIPYGDIWLRDTAPIFVANEAGDVRPAHFAFNGWGGKYVLDHDAEVSGRSPRITSRRSPSIGFSRAVRSRSTARGRSSRRASACSIRTATRPWIAASSTELFGALGGDTVLWLGDGLVNDHTEDTSTPSRASSRRASSLCMETESTTIPTATSSAESWRRSALHARRARHAPRDRDLPSPGRITDEEGRVMPASYVNFYIANHAVIVPTYGVAQPTSGPSPRSPSSSRRGRRSASTRAPSSPAEAPFIASRSKSRGRRA